MEDVYNYLKSKINNNDIIVASISGGPDSMALLNILIKLKKDINYKLIFSNDKYFTKEYIDNILKSIVID